MMNEMAAGQLLMRCAIFTTHLRVQQRNKMLYIISLYKLSASVITPIYLVISLLKIISEKSAH